MSSTTDTARTSPTDLAAKQVAASQAGAPGRRGPEEIERDIHDIRSRMDAVLEEIEFRLSPGQMSGGLIEVARDVVQGNPTRIARAIRSNPLPLLLIGAGAAWLAWTVSRTPILEAGAPPAAGEHLSDQRIRILLIGLVNACRQGAKGVRRAEMVLGEVGLSPRLSQLATQLDRSAAALDGELRRQGGLPEPEGPIHPAWAGLHEALERPGVRAATLVELEGGIDATLALFRDALHEPLPEALRIVIGAQFHEIETMRHRVGVLREAVA